MNNSKRCFVFILILMAAPSTLPAQAYRVVGCYPTCTRVTHPAQAVRHDVLTQINHAFALANPDGSSSAINMIVNTALINTDVQTVREGQ